MIKSKTSKIYLEVNNGIEPDGRNESTSKRNKKSKNATSTGRTMKVSGFKSKALMPSIIVNGKPLPVKSNSQKVSSSARTKKKAMATQSSRNRDATAKRRSRSISKKSMKRSKSVSAVGKLARDSRERLASTAKKRSSYIPKKSMKRSRMTIFRDVSGRFAKKTFRGSMFIFRDALGRFAEKKS